MRKIAWKKPMQPRPLVFCAAAFAGGVGMAALRTFPLWGIGIAVAMAVLSAIWVLRGWSGTTFVVLMTALFFLCGWMRGSAAWEQTPPDVPAQAILTGTVRSVRARTDARTEYILKDVYVDGTRTGETMVLNVYAPSAARPGDRVRAEASLAAVKNQEDSDFDAVLWRKTQGILIQAQASSCEVVGTSGALCDLPGRFAYSLKEVLAQQMDEQAGLVIGMTLGDTQWLSDAELQAFRDSGAAHVLAVSGLHIVFFMTVALWVYKRVGIKSRLALGGVLLLLWTYCLMVGMPASAVRACLMATIACVAQMLGLPYDLLTSIFASALAILCVAPLQLFTAGFCLSYAAVLGIALWMGNWTAALKRLHLPAWLTDSLSMSLAAQMGVLPVGLLFFARVSNYAVLTSLFAVPLSGILTIAGLCAALLGLCFAPLGMLVAKGVQGLAVCLQVGVDLCARLPGAVVQWHGVSVWDTLLWLCAMAATSPLCLWRTRTKWLVAAVLLALCWAV